MKNTIFHERPVFQQIKLATGANIRRRLRRRRSQPAAADRARPESTTTHLFDSTTEFESTTLWEEDSTTERLVISSQAV